MSGYSLEGGQTADITKQTWKSERKEERMDPLTQRERKRENGDPESKKNR